MPRNEIGHLRFLIDDGLARRDRIWNDIRETFSAEPIHTHLERILALTQACDVAKQDEESGMAALACVAAGGCCRETLLFALVTSLDLAIDRLRAELERELNAAKD